MDCSACAVNHLIPEMDPGSLPFLWEPLHKPMLPKCPVCGHPDYLPSGCCHWHVIRGLEKERDALRGELERLTAELEHRSYLYE